MTVTAGNDKYPSWMEVTEKGGLEGEALMRNVKGALEKALSQGTRFLLETDYIDDSRRPGAVLGPATVPRRTLALHARGLLTEEQAWTIHGDNPEKVFGR
jgi:TatD-related deoxyribonuclease